MSSRVNPPWKTFVLFLLIGGLGWAAYEFLYVRGILTGHSTEKLSQDQRDQMREAVVKLYAEDKCFHDVRGNINWRPRDDYYRVEIVVGDACEDRARDMCKEITELIERDYKVRSSAWAFDLGGRQLAQFVK